MERSEAEKSIYRAIVGVMMDELPYPLKKVENNEFDEEFVYDIPEDKKQEVLNQLWPFVDCPKMDDVMFDIHSGMFFKMKDFIVIRFDNYNMLCCPEYFTTGGTVVDMVKKPVGKVFTMTVKSKDK